MPVFHLLYPFLDDNTTKQTFRKYIRNVSVDVTDYQWTKYSVRFISLSQYLDNVLYIFSQHTHACLSSPFPFILTIKTSTSSPKNPSDEDQKVEMHRGLLHIKTHQPTLEPTKYFHCITNRTYCLQSPVSSRSTSPSHHIPSTFLHTHHVTPHW